MVLIGQAMSLFSMVIELRSVFQRRTGLRYQVGGAMEVQGCDGLNIRGDGGCGSNIRGDNGDGYGVWRICSRRIMQMDLQTQILGHGGNGSVNGGSRSVNSGSANVGSGALCDKKLAGGCRSANATASGFANACGSCEQICK